MKFKPFDSVKFLAVILVVVALTVFFAPKANAGHVSPEKAIAELANCLVLVRNTDMDPKSKEPFEKNIADQLDSYVPVYPELVIKYTSRSEGFLVGAAFGRYGDGNDTMDKKAMLATIANSLFLQYCSPKA